MYPLRFLAAGFIGFSILIALGVILLRSPKITSIAFASIMAMAFGLNKLILVFAAKGITDSSVLIGLIFLVGGVIIAFPAMYLVHKHLHARYSSRAESG